MVRTTAFGRKLGLVLLAVAMAACSEPELSVEELIQTARQDYVAFDFLAARDGFEEVLERDSDNAEAAYGLARTLMTLNQYEEAIPAFEFALELAPDDPRVHEGYLYTLVWGGELRGRRDWLDLTIEMGRETIGKFPNRVEPYESVQDATDELNQPQRWLQILNGLATHSEGPSAIRIRESPVFRIHQLKAQLAVVRSSEDQEAIAAVLDDIRQELRAAEATVNESTASGTESNPGLQYLLAAGNDILGDSDAHRSWLTRLDETPEGRQMGASMVHFDVYYMDYFESREEPLEDRLELIKRWQQRFRPTWNSGDASTYRIALNMEHSLWIQEARRQRDENGHPSDETLDHIIELSKDLVRLETWGATREYQQIAQLLIDFGVRFDEALGFADEAVAALREQRPGLIYPSAPLDKQESSRERWTATFEHLRGMALMGLDRDIEAEQAFRSAIDVAPDAERFASLGELLANLGSDQEAYEMLIAALAHGAEDDKLGTDIDRIRETAVKVAARTGRDEMALDADLEVASQDAADAARLRLIDNRLDRDAPDFNLTDTNGNAWRLSDLQGKVVLLNYWATWCGPCRSEFPHYRDLVASYASADDVVFLAITTDVDHSETREFLEENDYRFTVLFDEGSATDFHVLGIPAHFILGPEGRIQYATSGFPGAERYNEEMRWRIEALRTEVEKTGT